MRNYLLCKYFHF